jgi:hypothetical protein
VPVEFTQLDKRGVVRHSTRIKIAKDRSGRRAARVAERLNGELGLFWKGLSDGKPMQQLTSYENARRRARALGFDYLEKTNFCGSSPRRALSVWKRWLQMDWRMMPARAPHFSAHKNTGIHDFEAVGGVRGRN